MPEAFCAIREGFLGEVMSELSLRVHRLLQWEAAWDGGFPGRGQRGVYCSVSGLMLVTGVTGGTSPWPQGADSTG